MPNIVGVQITQVLFLKDFKSNLFSWIFSHSTFWFLECVEFFHSCQKCSRIFPFNVDSYCIGLLLSHPFLLGRNCHAIGTSRRELGVSYPREHATRYRSSASSLYDGSEWKQHQTYHAENGCSDPLSRSQ